MPRTIMTKRLALGLVLAVLAASIPPLRAEVLSHLGAGVSSPSLTAADSTAAVRS
jgi:hypothetical protein